jgi:hypothetical protein
MSETATLRSVRDVFWAALVLTCGAVLTCCSYFDAIWNPTAQNCILTLTYPGPPTVEFEDFDSGIAKLWITSMVLDYSC